MAKYYTILTKTGLAKLAAAIAENRQVELTYMAVGDGNGNKITPTENMTSLVNEVHRAGIDSLSVDPANPVDLRAKLIIPVNVGGWYIREAGIFDADGDLFAVGSLPESYKPIVEDGVGADFYLQLVIEVSNTEAVTLKVDLPSTLATKKDLEEHAAKIAKNGEYGHLEVSGNAFDVLSVAEDSETLVLTRLTELLNRALPPGIFGEIGDVSHASDKKTRYNKLYCNGQSFMPSLWPDFYQYWLDNGFEELFGRDSWGYPRMPDLRGMVIRAVDDGAGRHGAERGMERQNDAIRNITGTCDHWSVGGGYTSGAFTSVWSRNKCRGEDVASYILTGFDASRVVPTAPDNRMKSRAVYPFMTVDNKL